MVCKKIITLILFLVFFFYTFEFRSEILYEKNNLVITDFDIEYFSKNYEKIYSSKISTNQIIKNIVLLNNVFTKLNKTNPNLVKSIDENIINNISTNIYDGTIVQNFNRFIFIKNDFIKTYYKEFLSASDIEMILKNIKLEKISLSTNKCLTIDKIISFNEIENISNLIFNKIRGLNKSLYTVINSKNFEICFNDQFYYQLDIMLFTLIESRTRSDFSSYLYENQE